MQDPSFCIHGIGFKTNEAINIYGLEMILEVMCNNVFQVMKAVGP